MMNGCQREALAGTTLFRGLCPDLLDEALAAATRRTFGRGDSLVLQDEPPASLYVVRSGWVKISHVTPDGRPVALRFKGPGALVGSIAVLTGRPYPASAFAVTPVDALCWSAPRIRGLLDRHPPLAANALRALGERIETLLLRAHEGTHHPVERRLARTLLDLIAHGGEPVGEGMRVGFRITRQDLAELTGSTLYTVSRMLGMWEQEGIVTGGRQAVTIRRPALLREIASASGPAS